MAHHVGLLASATSNWIGGTIYQANILGCLNRFADKDRLFIHLLIGPRAERHWCRQLKRLADQSGYYGYHHDTPVWKRVLGCAVTAARGAWPRSILALAEANRIDLLFPYDKILGPGRPMIATAAWIPDFQVLFYPEFWPEPMRGTLLAQLERLIASSPHLVLSSNTAVQHLAGWRSRPADSVSVLRFASCVSEEELSCDPRIVAQQYRLPGKFLIFPSQFWRHKNHIVLLDALRILLDRGHRDVFLVCTGQIFDARDRGYFARVRDHIAVHNLGRSVAILGLLPRCRQLALLRRAAAVVQPSLFEGWSALVEDCRFFGKRVFVSDLPVHREQEPPNAHFFTPTSAEELASLIHDHWPHLTPGPDLAAERIARADLEPRLAAFAHSFEVMTKRALATQLHG